jgi:hypothetical protein
MMRDGLPLATVASGPSWYSAFSVPVKAYLPWTPALSNPRFGRTPLVRSALARNGPGTGSESRNLPSSE